MKRTSKNLTKSIGNCRGNIFTVDQSSDHNNSKYGITHIDNESATINYDFKVPYLLAYVMLAMGALVIVMEIVSNPADKTVYIVSLPIIVLLLVTLVLLRKFSPNKSIIFDRINQEVELPDTLFKKRYSVPFSSLDVVVHNTRGYLINRAMKINYHSLSRS